MPDDPPPLLTQGEPAAQRSLNDDIRQLAEDARNLAETELAYQASRAKLLGGSVGRIAGLGALALALVFFALMALVIGAVIALVPVLSAWGATVVVALALLVLAAIVAGVASRRWKRLSGLLADAEDRP